MLIKGNELTPKQREEVLNAFIYRWTRDNKNPARAKTQARIPLVSDDEWLQDHAFHFVTNGSRLMYNRRYCVPAYEAE